MKPSDFRCNTCKEIFEIWVKNNLENFPKNPKCEFCDSEDTYRLYTNIVTNMAEGKLGNTKNNFENNIVYHPSVFGKYKGKRIK